MVSGIVASAPNYQPWQLDSRRLTWLTACTAMVLAPHMLRLPLWITALFALLCVWRLLRARAGILVPPGRWVMLLIALGTLPGVWFSYGTLTGRQAGVALLTLLAASKLLETRNQRDAYVLCYLGFFLIVTSFLFSQSMLMAGYMLAVVVVLTTTLAVLTRERPGAGPWRELRAGGLLVAQALPLALLLFAVFPRIPGPLWGLPSDAHNGVTGLSDRMQMGNISSLTKSDAVAFRVRFDGPVPPREDLYWRGPVLEFTDGRSWNQSIERLYSQAPGFQHSGTAYDYEMILEPANNRILLALDLPATLPRDSVLSEAFSLRSLSRRSTRMRYDMRSYTNYRLEGSQLDRARSLGLPDGAHPQTRTLAMAFRRQARSPQDLVDVVLAYFREQPFHYTLTPPLLEGDPVDQFLFSTRAGFCEHYAAAFTVLMRMNGIPARVVTGYQGGEINPVGEYMVVRQRDAHAWAEVWLDGKGWTRVDPTAAVAPSRIDQGVDAALPASAAGVGSNSLGGGIDGTPASLLKHLRDGFDALQTGWNYWVLGFGEDRQRGLLSRFGINPSLANLALITVAIVTLFMAALALWLLRRRPISDPVQHQYLQFCEKLARRGLSRGAHEGPLEYGQRVSVARPDLAQPVNDILSRYVALRYSQRPGDLEALAERVKRFNA